MIDSTHRFHGHGSLRFVYGRGQTVRGSYGCLKYLPNPKRTTYRAAVVVSRKVHKSAVVRNRIRRRIYEALRHYDSRITGNYDMVFILFNEQPKDMPWKELLERMEALLERAGIISKAAMTPDNHAIVERKEK